jgi:hypothetical protein
MKGMLHGDNFKTADVTPFVKVFAGKLDGGFVCFGAAVAEKGPIGKTVLNQPGG